MNIYERSLALHREMKGKIGIRTKRALRSREDLSLLYTPGVAEASRRIAADPEEVDRLTFRGNMIAVVSDGTAVLGLGDIGPRAALPVMEGKALLFRELAGVEAFPVCLATKSVEEIVLACRLLTPTFAGINLEDISAPRCFEIEDRLRKELGIPVFHDDQHGTAIVVGAALLNALKVAGKPLAGSRIVISGIGAAGTAIYRFLRQLGADRFTLCDRAGILDPRDPATIVHPHHAALARESNDESRSGSLKAALVEADVFIGVSQPGLLGAADIRTMRKDAIVFAMANPDPEIPYVEAIAGGAKVVATGRSDFPNQVNNVLAFPGIFRGALDVGATAIDETMKVAACRALAESVTEPGPERILPVPLEPGPVFAVALATAKAAIAANLARRPLAEDELRQVIRKRMERDDG